MKFHIFASKDTNPHTNSKELRKHVVDGATYEAAIETLNAKGYEINDVWVEDDAHVTTNTQRSYHHENRQLRQHNRKGGYYR